ncbi:T-cell differentiation antigen CD6-like [Sinocyclocheilus grahami]|uniref:T-cell differentiation antigen CD6-like n=1 Tax=Sinocyclocheilus grahami TaxID=75366 RepID=UPI0007ACBDDD|nr:PREDICTED: T-cell differentiation antigen CD6-like [Sinocyclocheilus grahami]
MLLLLLCVVLQALSLSQGLNVTDERPSKSVKKHADHSDKQIELSTLNLSKGCFGVPRALYKNTSVDVTLNLLDAEEKKELALQICERLSCGRVFEHGATATAHNGTCLADCILRDSKLHNCTTAAKVDCMNATEVICEHRAVRLFGGRDHCAGRVELLHSGNWGTVCDDDFDINSGHVVCTQLRCGRAIRLDFFGPGTGPIHISQMKCNGSESSLWECSSINSTASNYCGHKEDAGVVCSESVEIIPTSGTTQLNLTTLVAVSTAMASAQSSSGVSAAAIGCVILSIALLMVIVLNAAAYAHFKRAKECVIYQQHSNSHTSLENQSNAQIGIYNTQSVHTAGGDQYENLAPRMSTLQDTGPPATSLGTPGIDITLPLLHVVDVNDSSSTSSGECYQNTEIDTDNHFMSREEKPSLHEKSPFAPLSYVDHHLSNSDSRAVDVNDSDSTSSGECYQNTKIDMDNSLQYEDEESPSLPEKSLQTPHSTQMTGNTAGYSGSHVPVTHSQDGNDSDSTSSEECYQNTEIAENAFHHYGEESPSLPEMSFQNPHIAQMTESTDGYRDHRVPRNLSQETDNSSTASEASYVNVPPKKEREDHSAASSESDYDEAGTW